MHKNVGFYKEEEIVLMLNEKKVCQLSNNAKYIIREIFEHPDEEAVVYAKRLDEFIKPDFYIRIGKNTHYISMKSGSSNTLHQEYVKEFCIYLRERGISNRTLQTILLYQFGDGTLDGTGKERFPYEKLRFLLADRLKEANLELNRDKEFVISIINRVVFKGAREENIEADYVYHGDKDYGILVSKKQMIKHCHRRDWAFIDSLHIGPILLRPHARYVGKEIKREKSRQRLEFYWPNYYADLDYISKRYDG
ncbi:MAG TPA: hypothetical protein PLH17_02915 [Bacilli bacterium]|nr:hypothetical protein [Bacilli bacterium]HOR20756.1 hypothetical protein [Bacilli bacterium]HPK67588.1 hypothetical protein [Bacilli bacterium]